MTQTDSIDALCDMLERELDRINAKLQTLIDIYRDGVTVYFERD